MRTPFPIRAELQFVGRLPKEIQRRGRHVVGKLGAKPADVGRWKEPPHRVLANLPRFDLVQTGALHLLDDYTGPERRDSAGKLLPIVELGAMEAFVKRYGVLQAPVDEMTDHFDEDAAYFTDEQDTLRAAWAGDKNSIGLIELQVRYALDAQASVEAGGIALTIDNLGSLVCVLFLLDCAEGKTAVCANPECPAPYFLRKRRDQKFCERGQCTTYAQRRYALGWWERKGYKLRATRAKVKPRKRR